MTMIGWMLENPLLAFLAVAAVIAIIVVVRSRLRDSREV